jgi:hypothetical protein
VVQLATSSGHPSPGNPWWLRLVFISRVGFDPVVAVGLASRRRWAVWSAPLLLALDAAANAYAVYVVIPMPEPTPARVGQGVIRPSRHECGSPGADAMLLVR